MRERKWPFESKHNAQPSRHAYSLRIQFWGAKSAARADLHPNPECRYTFDGKPTKNTAFDDYDFSKFDKEKYVQEALTPDPDIFDKK